MSKEKQKVNLAVTMPPAGAYDNNHAMFTAEYFADLAKDRAKAQKKVAPISQSQQQENMAREQKIKNLYPDSYEQNIPLAKLVPAPEVWNFFPHWNNEQIAELMENISVYGQLSPALVWEQTDGTFMILGGHNRFQAIKNLHDMFASEYPEEAQLYTAMRCNVYAHNTLDEVEARKIIIFDNTIRRENSKNIMRRSIINMNQLMKETRTAKKIGQRRVRIKEQIAEVMDISPRTVTGIVALRNLIPEFWPLFDVKDRSHRISEQLGRAISYLPEELQQYIYANDLYVNAHLSSSQLKQLRKAQDKETIDAVFTTPLKYRITANAEVTEPMPKDHHAFVLAAKIDELQEIKQVIQNSNVSQETKDWILKTL